MHEMAVIADVVTPSLDAMRQYSLPVLLLNSGLNFQGGKDLGEEGPVGCFLVEHVDSDRVVQA